MLAKALVGTRVVSLHRQVAPRRCAVATKAYAAAGVGERPLALPFAEPPEYLDGSLPCDYGFDPLRLAAGRPGLLPRMQEGELINGRFAMLGAVGAFILEPLGLGNWMEAPMWAVEGGKPTYLGIELPYPEGVSDVNNTGLLVVLEILLIGGAEALRGSESDHETRLYPGGNFDPLGMANTDPEQLMVLKRKEIAHGRLAMIACLAFYVQGMKTGEGPYANMLSLIK